REAENLASEDRAKREVIDARNEADSLAYQVEKLLNENRESIGAADRAGIEAAITEARRAAQTDDLAAIKRATEALKQTAAQASRAAQASAGSGRSQDTRGSQSQSSGVKDAEVVDAEYAETK